MPLGTPGISSELRATLIKHSVQPCQFAIENIPNDDRRSNKETITGHPPSGLRCSAQPGPLCCSQEGLITDNTQIQTMRKAPDEAIPAALSLTPGSGCKGRLRFPHFACIRPVGPLEFSKNPKSACSIAAGILRRRCCCPAGLRK